MSVLTLGTGYDSLMSIIDELSGLADLEAFLGQAETWDEFTDALGYIGGHEGTTVVASSSSEFTFSNDGYTYVVSGSDLVLINGDSEDDTPSIADYLEGSSGTISSIAVYDGDTLLGTITFTSAAYTVTVGTQSAVLEGADLPTALTVMQALGNLTYSGSDIINVDSISTYNSGVLVNTYDLSAFSSILTGISGLMDAFRTIGEIDDGGFTTLQLSTTQLTFEGDGGFLVINGTGLSYTGTTLRSDAISGTVTSVTLYSGGTYNSSTKTVTGGETAATLTVSSTQYVLVSGNLTATFSGSNLPTDVATLTAIADGTYSGSALGFGTLSLTNNGTTVLSASVSSTTVILELLGYTFTLTGSFDTSLTSTVLNELISTGTVTSTISASSLTVTDSNNATVLSVTGLTTPVSLYGDNSFLDTITSVLATGTTTDTVYDMTEGFGVNGANSTDITNVASIAGGSGDDTFYLGSGNITVSGGAGTDTVSFMRLESDAGVSVSLATTSAQVTGGAGTVTLSGIEVLEGSVRGDTLTGGSANDTLIGGAGNDVINGGAGTDTAVFASLYGYYKFFTDASGNLVVVGGDGIDTLSNVEYLQFDDQTVAVSSLTTTSGAIIAGASDTTVTGTSGNDTIVAGTVGSISAGAGDDLIYLSGLTAGTMTVDGGNGADTVRIYMPSMAQCTSSWAGAVAVSSIDIVFYQNAENTDYEIISTTTAVIFSGVSLVWIYGTGDDDKVDLLNFSAASLTVFGYDGDDTIRGGSSVVNSLSGGGGDDCLSGGETRDFLQGGAGEDYVSGGSGNDSLYGNAGNDTLYGGAGNDTLYGGTDDDTATFSGNYASYTVAKNSDGTYTVVGTDGTDTLSGIEYLQFYDQTVTLATPAVTSDFGGDGKSDILWTSTTGDVALWSMNGSTIASSAFVANPGSAWSVIGTGDFDSDGHTDILWRATDGSVALWTMNGTTMQTSAFLANPGSSWSVAGIGDFGGDGNSDILWRATDGTLAVWQMSGSTVSSASFVTNPGTDWSVVGVGDFNGDGNSDILWRATDGSVALWTMNGSTISSSSFVTNPGSAWSVAGVGDFNGDGNDDILWRATDGSVALWQMNGATISSSSLMTNPGTDWAVASIGDYSGDGKADILWYRETTGEYAVWVMNGSSITSSAVLSAAPGSAWSAVA